MPENSAGPFASASVARHLARGAVGFALIATAFVLAAGGTPLALALLAPGALALRGCPTCWLVGLVQTVGARPPRCGCDARPRAAAERPAQPG
jgi:hypothetical protein